VKAATFRRISSGDSGVAVSGLIGSLGRGSAPAAAAGPREAPGTGACPAGGPAPPSSPAGDPAPSFAEAPRGSCDGCLLVEPIGVGMPFSPWPAAATGAPGACLDAGRPGQPAPPAVRGWKKNPQPQAAP